MEFRPIEPGDRRWLRDALSVSWGSPEVVSRGVLHRADRLPGLVAWQGGERGGYLVHDGAGPTREIVALEVTLRGVGAGRALVEAAARQARAEGCARLRLITTNDNAPAIAFYRALGFDRVAVHEGAVAASRLLKPGIPRFGVGGSPIDDEWEFARDL